MHKQSWTALIVLGGLIGNAPDVLSQGLTTQQKERILQRFPQADVDQDGELSAAEEQAVYRRILQRYPQIDKDGDGVISDTEKQSLRRMAANRAESTPPSTPSSINTESKGSNPGALLQKLGLKSERDIPDRENTKRQNN